MKIAIQIVALGGRPVNGPAAVFDARGGTIGRRSDNTLVIPDKSRRVSRVHMAVSFHGGQFRVRDQGSFLPVYVNGHGVGFQRDMTIRPGDQLEMGPYTFAVTDASAPGAQRPQAPIDLEETVETRASPPVAEVPFELVEERLAAAKASGVLLTTESTAGAVNAFDPAETQEPADGGAPMGFGADTDEVAEPAEPDVTPIDLEPVGSPLVRSDSIAFPKLGAVVEAARTAELGASATNDTTSSPSPEKRSPARVISLLETARRVLGGKR